jgi:hypothetical protein
VSDPPDFGALFEAGDLPSQVAVLPQLVRRAAEGDPTFLQLLLSLLPAVGGLLVDVQAALVTRNRTCQRKGLLPATAGCTQRSGTAGRRSSREEVGMRPGLLGGMVDAGITFLIGLVVTLYGFRVIGPRPGEDPGLDERHRRWGRLFRVAGPILMGFGAVLAVSALFRGPAP